MNITNDIQNNITTAIDSCLILLCSDSQDKINDCLQSDVVPHILQNIKNKKIIYSFNNTKLLDFYSEHNILMQLTPHSDDRYSSTMSLMRHEPDFIIFDNIDGIERAIQDLALTGHCVIGGVVNSSPIKVKQDLFRKLIVDKLNIDTDDCSIFEKTLHFHKFLKTIIHIT